jgi:hypothetical protein
LKKPDRHRIMEMQIMKMRTCPELLTKLLAEYALSSLEQSYIHGVKMMRAITSK